MNRFNFARVSAVSPKVAVGNPSQNAKNILNAIMDHIYDDVIVFPELSITGYTCADLFRNQSLLQNAETSIKQLCASLYQTSCRSLIFVGAPVDINGVLFNCAIAIQYGKVIGIVPKQHIPNYSEFYEKRWFKGANTDVKHYPAEIVYAGRTIPFGTNLIFDTKDGMKVFCEICEDLFMPIPPSSFACMHGANVVVNLSASPESVAKAEYRMELVRNQSGRCLAAYVYSSAGPSESTTDLVFSGHCIICENGNTLGESSHIGDGTLNFEDRSVTADIDIDRLDVERRRQETFFDGQPYAVEKYRYVDCHLQRKIAMNGIDDKRIGGGISQFEAMWDKERERLRRIISETPFVPADPQKLESRCAAVFDIQCAGLAKRLSSTGYPDVYIGVSGGLDSTHALMVAYKTFKKLNLSLEKLHGISMPGFGTTDQTRNIAGALMSYLDISQETVDIRPICMQMLLSMNHNPFGINLNELWAKARHTASNTGMETMSVAIDKFKDELRNLPQEHRKDLVFENIQARARTFVLMSKGFVIGTGDMSEGALGWSTYNGDHMSMYNVNASVPKTLIKFMVQYVAKHEYPQSKIQQLLEDVCGLTISPELLPPTKDGKIAQSTEDTLGPYIIHDFVLANFVLYGYSPKKIYYLAQQSPMANLYTGLKFVQTMKTFIKRFMSQQFKRSCVPDGPKVGTLSLSPRGDWRQPTDIDGTIWMKEVEELEQSLLNNQKKEESNV